MVYGRSANDRQRMIDANDQLQSSSSRLEQACRQAMETEDIGKEVASDLRQQRDTIMRSKAGVGTIGSNYGMAKSMIEGMQRRAEANRLMTRCVVVFMVVVLAGAAYFMLG